MVPCQGPDSVWLHASDSHQNRVVRPESNLMEWHLEEVNELQDAHNEEELPTSTLPQHKLFGPGPHTRNSREDSDEGDDAVILEELTRKRPKKRTGSAMPLDIFNLDVEYEPPERPAGWVGDYSPRERKERIDRFLVKRIENRKAQIKPGKVGFKYQCRKDFALSRMRVKGRFVGRTDEELMRELMSLT
ncbi:hypothetical protein TeGR_g8136 [Tetraparma gracilis]|uniref:CCT domain-containing protein n=1 Tax=Tetraparma gracilis TaxID=2962635 RepID=A0ABQ6M8H9_9STRA|nr:hypothetical protein TeGR_g8136 [Tetraparma gracilis]